MDKLKNTMTKAAAFKVRIQWRLIFGNLIRCSRLRLWVGYFIYSEFTSAFFWKMFLMNVH